jgi:hypothetical protein
LVSSAVNAIKKSIQKPPTNSGSTQTGSLSSLVDSAATTSSSLTSSLQSSSRKDSDGPPRAKSETDLKSAAANEGRSKRLSVQEHMLVSAQLQGKLSESDLKAAKDRAEKAAAYLSQYGVASVKLAKKTNSIRAVVNPNGGLTIAPKSELISALTGQEPDGYFEARKRLSSIAKSAERLSLSSLDITSSRKSSMSTNSEASTAKSKNFTLKFEETEILGLKLMFSLFDRYVGFDTNTYFISHCLIFFI